MAVHFLHRPNTSEKGAPGTPSLPGRRNGFASKKWVPPQVLPKPFLFCGAELPSSQQIRGTAPFHLAFFRRPPAPSHKDQEEEEDRKSCKKPKDLGEGREALAILPGSG